MVSVEPIPPFLAGHHSHSTVRAQLKVLKDGVTKQHCKQ
jgi:hypothetical protein